MRSYPRENVRHSHLYFRHWAERCLIRRKLQIKIQTSRKALIPSRALIFLGTLRLLIVSPFSLFSFIVPQILGSFPELATGRSCHENSEFYNYCQTLKFLYTVFYYRKLKESIGCLLRLPYFRIWYCCKWRTIFIKRNHEKITQAASRWNEIAKVLVLDEKEKLRAAGHDYNFATNVDEIIEDKDYCHRGWWVVSSQLSDLITCALEAGKHVVSANKDLLLSMEASCQEIAKNTKGSLLWSRRSWWDPNSSTLVNSLCLTRWPKCSGWSMQHLTSWWPKWSKKVGLMRIKL